MAETVEKTLRLLAQIREIPLQTTSLPISNEQHITTHVQEHTIEETMDTWQLVTNTERKRNTSSHITTHHQTSPPTEVGAKRNRFETIEPATLTSEHFEDEEDCTEERQPP